VQNMKVGLKSFFQIRNVCLFLPVYILLSGCVTSATKMLLPEEDILYTQARYGEMERIMVAKVQDTKTASIKDLWNLCLAYGGVKRYNKLFECVDQMDRRIAEGDHAIRFLGIPLADITPWPAILLAQTWIELGDYKKARKEAERACELAKTMKRYGASLRAWLSREELDIYIHSYSIAGLAYALNEDKSDAHRMIEELAALEITRDFRGFDTMRYMAIARIHIALGEYDRALEAINWDRDKENMRKLDRIFSGEFLVGDTLNVFAEAPKYYIFSKLLLETGRIEEARTGYEQFLQMPQVEQNGELYWLALFDRGRIAEVESDFELAISFYLRAVEVIERQRATIHTETRKIGFVGDKQEVYRRLVSVLFHQGRYVEAFNSVERAKARALVDILASKQDFRGGKQDASPQLTSMLEDLTTSEMKTLIQDNDTSPLGHASTRSIMVEIKNKISQANPELASLISVTPPDVMEIQHLLAADETLVEFYGVGKRLLVFVVTREGVRGLELEARELNREINEFRKSILERGSNRFKVQGNSLYKKLIQPLEAMITSQNLTIVSHGSLHYLPFSALNSEDGYLIDKYSIRVLPSASVMKFLKGPARGPTDNLLAFGNPDLGDSRFDLPGAEKEAIMISKEQPDSRVLIRNQATETALKHLGGQFRYIHFATHGTFTAEKPLASGLLMTADGENDGTLTVGELYDLRLKADLVTLSACETALGKVANGDDVVGFTRGFLYAGARSIVSSLWKVDDQATSILMQEFYKELQEKDKREALRTAQLKVKNTYNSHPYFWAAFQITGAVE
jgi:CHAT domain-containing protein